MNTNFSWISEDIKRSLSTVIFYKDNSELIMCGNYEVVGVYETTGRELDIENGNIDDITNLLTIGIVRLVNNLDSTDVIDIPLRKLFILFKLACMKSKNCLDDMISSNELEAFSVVDGRVVSKNVYICPIIIGTVSSDLQKLLEMSSMFSSSDYQQQFDMLKKVNDINIKRLEKIKCED